MYLKESYVYAYYDEQGYPYYIGKGRGQRCYNKHLNVRTPTRDKIKKLYKDLNDSVACDIEENLILKYGRKDIGTGILLNRYSRSASFSQNVIEIMRKKAKERPKNNIQKNPTYRKRQSEIMKSVWQDPARKKRYSVMMKARRQNPKSKERYSKILSEQAKIRWQNPEYRRIITEKAKQK